MENKCMRPACENVLSSSSRKFCSVSCSSRTYERKSSKILRNCKRAVCESTFSVTPSSKKVYCSSSCSASVTNKARDRRARRCEYVYCNQHVNNSRARYCSIEHNTLAAELDRAFIAVTTGEMPVSNSSAKKLMKSLFGVSCSMDDCGISFWKGGEVPLVLDHIDGNSENHTLGNLRLVCGNCDMLLPTYKSKNIGNGRHSRRVRYQEGKSY